LRIAAGQNDGYVLLQSTTLSSSWSGAVQVLGHGTIDQKSVERMAMAATVTWGTIPQFNAVRSRRSGALELLFQPSDVLPLQVQIGSQAILDVARGGKIELPVRLVRNDKANANCVFRPKNLPPKITLGETTVPGNAQQATMTVQVAKDALPGSYNFWLQNETKFKWRNNLQGLERAQQYRDSLKSALEKNEAAADRKVLEEALKAAEQEVEALTKAAAESEITAFLPTPFPTIRVRNVPFDLYFERPVTRQGGKVIELLCFVDRVAGFDGPVQWNLAEEVKTTVHAISAEANPENPSLFMVTVELKGDVPTPEAIPVTLQFRVADQDASHAVQLPLN
jgi:hypothetical protein